MPARSQWDSIGCLGEYCGAFRFLVADSRGRERKCGASAFRENDGCLVFAQRRSLDAPGIGPSLCRWDAATYPRSCAVNEICLQWRARIPSCWQKNFQSPAVRINVLRSHRLVSLLVKRINKNGPMIACGANTRSCSQAIRRLSIPQRSRLPTDERMHRISREMKCFISGPVSKEEIV